MCGWDGYVYFLEILYYESPISTQEGAYTESKWHYLPIDPLRLHQHLHTQLDCFPIRFQNRNSPLRGQVVQLQNKYK